MRSLLKKKEDLTSISEKNEHICYIFDEKKVNNNFLFLANFDHFGGNESNFEEFSEFQLFFYQIYTITTKLFFKIFQKIIAFTKKWQKWRKSKKNP